MIRNRYISTLLNFNNQEITNGLKEINSRYGNVIKFQDRLICFIIKNI